MALPEDRKGVCGMELTQEQMDRLQSEKNNLDVANAQAREIIASTYAVHKAVPAGNMLGDCVVNHIFTRVPALRILDIATGSPLADLLRSLVSEAYITGHIMGKAGGELLIMDGTCDGGCEHCARKN